GVISILRKSIPRHLRYVGQMGVADRMAGDRAIGLGVVELSDEARTFARMAEVAVELRDEDGADVLVMGCAGMARYRDRLLRRAERAVVAEPGGDRRRAGDAAGARAHRRRLPLARAVAAEADAAGLHLATLGPAADADAALRVVTQPPAALQHAEILLRPAV